MMIEIITSSQNSWCPYCANQRLCSDKTCRICFLKSFASQQKSIRWSNKNVLSTRDFSIFSNERAFFNCDKCPNHFESRIADVSTGYWCGRCVYKTEKKLDGWLRLQYENVETQKSFPFTKTTQSCKKYDFYLPDKNVLIELGKYRKLIEKNVLLKFL